VFILWVAAAILLIAVAVVLPGLSARAQDKSIDKYTQAIAKNPKDPIAYYERGCAYYEKVTLADNKAMNDWSEAIRLDPKYLAAYIARGDAYAEGVEYEKAIVDFSHAIDLDPQNAALYCKRANAATALERYGKAAKDYNKAIADYSTAIKIDSKNAEYYRLRGIAYEYTKLHQKAIDDFQLAVSLDPRMNEKYKALFAEPYGNRAVEYLVLKQYDRAIENLNKAISLDPGEVDFYYNRGIAYEELGQQQKAKDDFVTAWKNETIQDGDKIEDYTNFRWTLLNDYTRIYNQRQWDFNDYQYRPIADGLQILQGNKQENKPVFSAKVNQNNSYWLVIPFAGVKKIATAGKLAYWDYSQLKPAKTPAIRMDKSLPPMLIIGHHPEGAHPPADYKLFALGNEFKKIAELNSSNNAGSGNYYFVDFYGNGYCAAVGNDNVFAYWHAAYCDSPQATIILRLEKDKFVLAEDLMKSPPPDEQYIASLVKQTKIESLSSEGQINLSPLKSTIWSNMIQLIYSGNGNLAWKYLDKVWPNGKTGSYQDDSNHKLITKAQFVKDFKKQLSTSQYWSDLKHLNGW